jgi:hypothetical protein
MDEYVTRQAKMQGMQNDSLWQAYVKEFITKEFNAPKLDESTIHFDGTIVGKYVKQVEHWEKIVAEDKK